MDGGDWLVFIIDFCSSTIKQNIIYKERLVMRFMEVGKIQEASKAAIIAQNLQRVFRP